MTATAPDVLRPPLSTWEQQLFDHFTAHTEQEADLVAVYQNLAERSPSDFVRYLAALLVDDEQRHHRIFTQLANTMVDEANLTRGDEDVPPLSYTRDVASLLGVTEQLIRLEEEDKAQLARLRRELRPVRETTMWDLLVQLAERDTEKHLLILRFIAAVSREAARVQSTRATP